MLIMYLLIRRPEVVRSGAPRGLTTPGRLTANRDQHLVACVCPSEGQLQIEIQGEQHFFAYPEVGAHELHPNCIA